MKTRSYLRSIGRLLRVVVLAAAVLGLPLWAARPAAAAAQWDIAGPAGSGVFGESVTVLPNGNIVVTDRYYDAGATADVGAVYLYDGATRALIGALTGSTTEDYVGYNGVVVVANSNYVVLSPYWDNGGIVDAGAATWVNGATGLSGPVSAANSLVGSAAGDEVGSDVTALSNGSYLVLSPNWGNGGAANAGAVTWASGAAGIAGPVSAANSLVGAAAGDQVGSHGVTALSNGNYVVRSPWWDNGGMVDTGAATWGSGAAGVTGPVSAANSLVGSHAEDFVAFSGVTALSNGNYVVLSPNWDLGGRVNAGAATWGDGVTGTSGAVSSANSLVGYTAGDQVGHGGVTALSNGNYVVSTPNWRNGSALDAGAATWGNGATGTTGEVSTTNSLVGSTSEDEVGSSVTALSKGHYVVGSPNWDNGGAADAGAATWGSGTAGIAGPVSAANSLAGSQAGDRIGSSVTALSNGNYVVSSSYWDNGGIADAGAATWGRGSIGVSGPVSAANSLVGATAGDGVGSSVTALSNGNYVVGSSSWDKGGIVDVGAATWGSGASGLAGPVSTHNSLVGATAGDGVGSSVTALSNGNYVVGSPSWGNGGVAKAGAATWGNGITGAAGPVSAANSLVGTTAYDGVGSTVTALSNGNYVVTSADWDNVISEGNQFVDAGAVTWGDGATGTAGPVSAANSLVGSTADDQLGDGDVTVLGNGHYLVFSPYWDNGATEDAGAVTWGDGRTGVAGPITAGNSVRGTAEYGGDYLSFAYDHVHNQLVVGRPADNVVTLFRPFYSVFLPAVVKNGS